MDEVSGRLKTLLREAGTSQREIARWWSERLGYRVHRSRVSRGLRGKVALPGPEKAALFEVLCERGVVRDRADGLFVAGQLGLARAVLDERFPPPGVVTNLAPPGERVFVRPAAYDALLEGLISERPLGERERARFVVLVGAPGSGKSELVHRLAFDEEVAERYDVALYASLRGRAPADATALLNGWLIALGERPAAEEVAGPVLQNRLRERRTLVILDDLPGPEWVERLWVGDERGGVLAVCSQAVADGMGVAGRDVVEISLWDEGQAGHYLERMMGAALTPAQTARVAVLNRRVDGLPLAWSLLVPWLRGAADWRAVTEVLAASPLQALGRVERCFAAAYERLPEEAQTAVRALAVFAEGSFDAEAVGAVLGVSTGEAARRVAALKAAAWLRESPPSPPQARYRLHRLLHGYAVKVAAEDPQRERHAERHARFYARRAAPLLERQHEADWPGVVRGLLPDLPNVYRGQAWAAEHRSPLVLDFFLHLAPYFSAFRERERWQTWAEAALEVVEGDPKTFPAIDRFSLYSQLGWGEGSFEERLACLRRAHEIATTEMEPWNGVYTLCDLADLHTEAGELVEAEAALLEAWQMAEASDRSKLRAWALREIGLYYARTLNRAGCRVVVEGLARTPAVSIGGGLKGAYDAASRGRVLACAGRWAEASSLFREALAVHGAADNPVQESELRLQVARCLAYLDRDKEAREEIAAVEGHLDELPPEVVGLYHVVAGETARLRGDCDAAVAHLSGILDSMEPVFRWRVEFDAWLNLGQALQALGREAEAESALASAQELAVRDRQPFWLWEVNRCRWVSECQTDSLPQASELLSVLRGMEEGAPPASTG